MQGLARMFVGGEEVQLTRGGGKIWEATDTELFQLPMFGSQPIGSVSCFSHQRYAYVPRARQHVLPFTSRRCPPGRGVTVITNNTHMRQQLVITLP